MVLPVDVDKLLLDEFARKQATFSCFVVRKATGQVLMCVQRSAVVTTDRETCFLLVHLADACNVGSGDAVSALFAHLLFDHLFEEVFLVQEQKEGRAQKERIAVHDQRKQRWSE